MNHVGQCCTPLEKSDVLCRDPLGWLVKFMITRVYCFGCRYQVTTDITEDGTLIFWYYCLHDIWLTFNLKLIYLLSQIASSCTAREQILTTLLCLLSWKKSWEGRPYYLESHLFYLVGDLPTVDETLYIYSNSITVVAANCQVIFTVHGILVSMHIAKPIFSMYCD